MQQSNFHTHMNSGHSTGPRAHQQPDQSLGITRSLSGIRRLRSDGRSIVYFPLRRLCIAASFPLPLPRGLTAPQPWIQYTHLTITQNLGSMSPPNLLRHPSRLPQPTTTACHCDRITPSAAGDDCTPVYHFPTYHVDQQALLEVVRKNTKKARATRTASCRVPTKGLTIHSRMAQAHRYQSRPPRSLSPQKTTRKTMMRTGLRLACLRPSPSLHRSQTPSPILPKADP